MCNGIIIRFTDFTFLIFNHFRKQKALSSFHQTVFHENLFPIHFSIFLFLIKNSLIYSTIFLSFIICMGFHNGKCETKGCYLIQWRSDLSALTELNTQIILCGFALLMLPLFFISTLFKVRLLLMLHKQKDIFISFHYNL